MAVGTLTPAPALPALPRSLSPWRCTVAAYERMYAAGILDPDLQTELLDGRIYVVPPPGLPHCAVLNRLTRLMVLGLGDRAIVQIQGGIQLPPWSYPMPDLALLAPDEDFYDEVSPRPAQIHLFVEVAQSSLYRDRKTKLPVYARAGIPEYWIVDVKRRQVLVHRRPTGSTYTDLTVLSEADRVSPAAFPELRLALPEILGRRKGR